MGLSIEMLVWVQPGAAVGAEWGARSDYSAVALARRISTPVRDTIRPLSTTHSLSSLINDLMGAEVNEHQHLGSTGR